MESETSLTFWLDTGFTRRTSTNKPKGYRNSQGHIFTRKWNQVKPFGLKIANKEGYKKKQEQKFSKLPVRRNTFSRKQKKNFGKVLLPYVGKQIV
jgi:hypothetical protein